MPEKRAMQVRHHHSRLKGSPSQVTIAKAFVIPVQHQQRLIPQ
jgi:hypothetical protein